MARRKKKKRRKLANAPKRLLGFLCRWCNPQSPHNERFVPHYYRPPEGHRKDQKMCYSCNVEGAGAGGMVLGKKERGKQRPTLTPETLEAFWKEDVSDGDYVECAMEYFQVRRQDILQTMKKIQV